jgi:MFS transporter, PAT family, beta-lactamase induction signal transducer AmpG
MHHEDGKGATGLSFLRPLFSDARIAAMLVLGFASGIPYQLVYITQSAWLYEAKVPIGTIGMMSELTLAYKLKFVWAPFLDRYDAPVLGRLLGRRRGWIVVSQLAVMAALVGVAFGDPGRWLAWTVVFSLALGFAGATQDVVIDGWRINVAPSERQALMASWSEVGYRVGVLAAGAGALLLADRLGWRATYFCMAALMTVGTVAAFLAPEPESDKTATHPPLSFVSTVIAPIKELVTRLAPMAILILILVAGFRMPGYISNAMAVPLFKSLHYSDTDIATVTKLFGFWVGLGGTFFASFVMPRLGMMASLLIGTVAGSASHLALAWLAAHGNHEGTDFWTFAIAVSIDSFAYSFASIVLITYMSSLTTTQLAASQFALLTSICALPGGLVAGVSGYFVQWLGFERFFIATSLIGAPVAALCWWVWRRQANTREEATGRREAAAE